MSNNIPPQLLAIRCFSTIVTHIPSKTAYIFSQFSFQHEHYFYMDRDNIIDINLEIINNGTQCECSSSGGYAERMW